MRTYYWEGPGCRGKFRAKDDAEAKRKKKAFEEKGPKILIMYRESNTDDGTPFVEIE